MNKPSKRFSFYIFMAVLMIVVNIIGFAPSYFLKPLFDYPELPVLTHVHGIFFSSWFLLFFVQGILIHRKKIKIHRTLGKIGAVLALIMTVSATQILYFRVLEFDGTTKSLQNTALVFSGNAVLLFMFVLFTTLGIVFRMKSDWHKRFMLFACISMMPQALGRFGRLPLPTLTDVVPNEVFFGVGGLLFFILATCVYEFIRFKRLHLASAIGGPFIFLMIVLGAMVLPKTSLIKDLIVWINA